MHFCSINKQDSFLDNQFEKVWYCKATNITNTNNCIEKYRLIAGERDYTYSEAKEIAYRWTNGWSDYKVN